MSSAGGAAGRQYCVRYAQSPVRSIFYMSDDCTAKGSWGYSDASVGTGGALTAFPSQQPGTVKYCYWYASSGTDSSRMLFLRLDDCTARWGWGYNDISALRATGGEVWMFPSQAAAKQAGYAAAVKLCYRYSDLPLRTLFYRSDDCSSRVGWGYADSNAAVGSGGEVWAPLSQLSYPGEAAD